MKKIHQTKFGRPDGNCFAACLATLLGLPLEEVPEFQWGLIAHSCKTKADCQCARNLDEAGWWQRARNWLKERGLAAVQLNIEDRPDALQMLPYGLPMMVSGKSPRAEFLHSVIYMNGELWHDPHPDGDGIDGDPEDVCILAPMEPWKDLHGKD